MLLLLQQVGTGTPTYDNPSNNFCTFNPLNNYCLGDTFTNGNTTLALLTGASKSTYSVVTQGMLAGKWYMEIEYTSSLRNDSMVLMVCRI